MLRDQCLLVVRLIREAGTPSELLQQIEDAIHGAFEGGNVRGLRTIAEDLIEWADGLPPSARAELDELLESRFGAGLIRKKRLTRRQVKAIVTRGNVANPAEFRLLSRRAEELFANPLKASELETINRLLAAYEARHRSS